MRHAAYLIAATLLASAATAQDTRGVRILPAEPEAPAPEPEPSPTPRATPVPRATPTPHATPTPRPTPTPTPRATPRPVEPAPIATPRPASPRPAAPPCIRAFPTADLAFEDGSAPRKKLADRLKAMPDRLVLDVAPFDPTRVPASLDPWFAELRDAGGSVRESEIKCTRGFSFGRLFGGLFGKRDPAKDYATIRGYDATLWIDASQGRVRQIELRRRPPA